jgi:hypothetical protein
MQLDPNGRARRQMTMNRAIVAVSVIALVGLVACAPGWERWASSHSDTGSIDWSSPQELPPPRYEDYRSEFVSEEKGWRFSPRSDRIKPGVAYRFETTHCGLSYLTDFDGSFWRPVPPADGQSPDFFINQDVGAIALVDFDTAIYQSSTGVEVSLRRLDGDVVTHPCG